MPEKDRAAARLLARSLSKMNTVDAAWTQADAGVVCATTSGEGVHMYNIANDFHADVHLVCETDAVAAAGNLPAAIPREDHGPVYYNAAVYGVRDDYTGYGLPTHVSGREEATVREDLPPEVKRLARQAGVDLDP